MTQPALEENDEAVDTGAPESSAELLVLNVGSERAWRVLGSPYRMRLYEAIRRLGECTISELAAHAGTKPVNLYYHLRALENTGLVESRGRRKGVARRAPVLYGAAHRRLEIEFDPENEEHQQRMEAIRKSWQREASDAIETGIRSRDEGRPGQFIVQFRWESLSTGEREEIARHFSDIIDILDRPRHQLETESNEDSLMHIGLQMVEHFEPKLPAPRLETRPRTADDSQV